MGEMRNLNAFFAQWARERGLEMAKADCADPLVAYLHDLGERVADAGGVERITDWGAIAERLNELLPKPGKEAGMSERCSRCKGRAMVPCPVCNPAGHIYSVSGDGKALHDKCSHCQGSGKEPVEYEEWPVGKTNESIRRYVAIPPGCKFASEYIRLRDISDDDRFAGFIYETSGGHRTLSKDPVALFQAGGLHFLNACDPSDGQILRPIAVRMRRV